MHHISKIAIDIPRCPVNIARKIPLSKWTGEPPPQARDLNQRESPNTSDRQRWFEANVLMLISTSSGSRQIPWRFTTPNGKRWQLDKGCVGHAMANGVLEIPADLEQVLSHVNVVTSIDDVKAAENGF